jgi:hypothetical protein
MVTNLDGALQLYLLTYPNPAHGTLQRMALIGWHNTPVAVMLALVICF